MPFLCANMPYEQTIALYQPLLHSIAYNLVRCKEDAEDIVQETFLKLLTLGPQKVENMKAYLITSVINNCKNHLNALNRKKEELLSQVSQVNLSEILNRFKETNFTQLDVEVNIQAALKVIQQKLEPLERAVYLLKEVFDFDYETMQETLDRKKDHCRQLFLRAKNKLKSDTFKVHVELPDASVLTAAFRKACYLGHADELLHVLKKEIPTRKQQAVCSREQAK
ncbi:MAG TPA: sigma-70 family RNA polymerase sigma factor [Cyclobacteriaceae bacterium]|nr:sigma-70 family RNA polymerase sigma factor [Cyclobacteriaceae bacterium]